MKRRRILAWVLSAVLLCNAQLTAVYAAEQGTEPAPPAVSDTALEGAEALPPESGDSTAPDAGETLPPEGGDSTAPDAGETLPPEGGDSTAPDAGETLPPEGGDSTAPDAGETLPPEGEDGTAPDAAPETPVGEDWVADTRDLSDAIYQAGGLGVFSDEIPSFDAAYNRQAVMNTLLDGFKRQLTTIQLAQYNIPRGDDIWDMVYEVINNHPELYYVETGEMISRSLRGVVQELVVKYDARSSQAEQDKFNAAVRQALTCVNDKMSPREKALALHDYLAQHAAYDTSLSKYDAYNALVERDVVCQGYALAYMLLLRECGIESRLATSGKDKMNHAWNYVKLDGKWYHVDVTWDDPLFGNKLVGADAQVEGADLPGYVGHDFFLLSDSGISDESHGHYGWNNVGITCTDKQYEAANAQNFWLQSNAAVIYVGNTAYYIDSIQNPSAGDNDWGLLRRDGSGRTYQVFPGIQSWPVWDKPGYHYLSLYASLSRDGDMLYLNDYNTVYVVPLKNEKLFTKLLAVYNWNVSSGYLFGSRYWNGRMELGVSRSPNEPPIVQYVTITMPQGVWIDAETFPDEAFRVHVGASFDSNGDGFLTTQEAAAVREIDLSGGSGSVPVRSLKGVEHFPRLETLWCANNQLTELDLSGNPMLKALYCGSNRLTELDVNGNPALTELYCGGNPLVWLDVSNLSNLRALDCSMSGITALDLQRNTKLQKLYCRDDALDALDLSHNPALEILSCENCGLRELDLSKNTALSALYCGGNRLAYLDLTGTMCREELSAANQTKQAWVKEQNGVYTLDVKALMGGSTARLAKVSFGSGVSYNSQTGIATFAAADTVQYSYQARASGAKSEMTVNLSCLVEGTQIGSEIYTIKNNVISDIPAGATASEVLQGLQGGAVCIKDAKGRRVSDKTRIGTGFTMGLGEEGDRAVLTAVVYGDVNSDGKIDVNDIIAVRQAILRIRSLRGVYLQAATPKSNNASCPTMNDVITMRQYVLRIISSVRK